jgi:hypothetical protein
LPSPFNSMSHAAPIRIIGRRRCILGRAPGLARSGSGVVP